MPRDFRMFLEDMREAGEKIRRYAAGHSFDSFSADEKTIDAIVRNLEILGEAAKRIPEDARLANPQVDWYRISGLRDIMIHQYFGFDLVIIGDVVENKLPDLLQQLDQILGT